MAVTPIAALFRSRATPLIVATALFMENLDATVLSTSLPSIAQDLGTSPIHLKLALTSYLLALAIFIPASGWVADTFGARKVFRWAIIVFAAGSIACGASDTLGQLVAARVLQGLGGSMMVPVGRLIVLRATPKAGLVGAMAWLTVPALIGPVMGPLVGGFITTYFHWRWIFWINIPIAVLGVALVTAWIPRMAGTGARSFDLTGFLMIGLGLAASLTGLTLAGLGLWSREAVAALTLAGTVLVALYARHALRVPAPLIDLRLLRLQTFRVAATGGTFFRVASGSLPFLLPLLLQLGFGLSAFQSGSLTFATGLGAMLMKFIAQPILRRWGFRRVLIANACIGAAFLFAPAFFTAGTPWMVMLLLLFAGGISRSLQFTALNAIAYSEVEGAELSSATSFSSILQQLSGSVGITIAAFAIEAAQGWWGTTEITAVLFPPVFGLMAVLALASALFYSRLPGDAGSALLTRQPAA